MNSNPDIASWGVRDMYIFLCNINPCDFYCNLNTYFDYANYYCKSCLPHCSVCENDSTCEICAENYKLHLGECVITCPEGYYTLGHKCITCAVPNCNGSCDEHTDHCNTSIFGSKTLNI